MNNYTRKLLSTKVQCTHADLIAIDQQALAYLDWARRAGLNTVAVFPPGAPRRLSRKGNAVMTTAAAAYGMGTRELTYEQLEDYA